jgi:hypothetical protein
MQPMSARAFSDLLGTPFRLFYSRRGREPLGKIGSIGGILVRGAKKVNSS